MSNGEVRQLDEERLRKIAQTLKIGVAIVESETLNVLFENALFFKWFPPKHDADEPLPERMMGFNTSRILKRIQEGRAFNFETESQVGERKIPISVEVRPSPDDGTDQIVVECHDLSKQKQSEYMLESYSKLAEKNAKELEREKDRVERLLLNVMPKSVYEEMMDYGTVTPQLFTDASILMIDFVGHTEMAVARDPGIE
jgi:hypothetical protein